MWEAAIRVDLASKKIQGTSIQQKKHLKKAKQGKNEYQEEEGNRRFLANNTTVPDHPSYVRSLRGYFFSIWRQVVAQRRLGSAMLNCTIFLGSFRWYCRNLKRLAKMWCSFRESWVTELCFDVFWSLCSRSKTKNYGMTKGHYAEASTSSDGSKCVFFSEICWLAIIVIKK